MPLTLFLQDPFQYYPPIYTCDSQVVSFLYICHQTLASSPLHNFTQLHYSQFVKNIQFSPTSLLPLSYTQTIFPSLVHFLCLNIKYSPQYPQ